MTYLYILIFVAAMSIGFWLLAFLIEGLLLRLPIKQIKLGFSKAASYCFRDMTLVIGWIPLGSSIEYQEAYADSLSTFKQWLLKLLNSTLTLTTFAAWLLIGRIDLQTLKDCFAVSFFQMPIEAFITAHGPMDFWRTGAMVLSILWIATTLHLLMSAKDTKISQVWNMFIFLVGLVALLGLLGHLCFVLWGK